MDRRRLRHRLLALSLPIAFVLALELTLRGLGVGSGPEHFRFRTCFPAKAADTLLVTHPRRVYTLAANQRMTPTHAGRYANGEWPFRGRPPGPAPAGIARVVFAGDSCIFGTGVDASQTLGHEVELELARRGLGQDRVQLVNLGVPGYSVVQVSALLEESLPELAPRAVVLYVGAWNDQSPAVDEDDIALLAQPREPSTLAHGIALVSLLQRLHFPRIALASEPASSGIPRVPEREFEARLRALVADCRRAGAWTLVVAPAHPASTAEEFPRTRRDAATCLRVARELDCAAIDAQAVVEPLHADSRFLDLVHLSPPALALLAEPVADALEAELAPRLPAPAVEPQGTLECSPASVTTFGDAHVSLRAVGFEFPDDGFALVVGGAPVLELERVSAHECRGLLAANGPGEHELVVQSRSGVRVFPRAVRYVLPELSVDGTHLHLKAAAGARVLLAGSGALSAPRFSPQGALELDSALGWPSTLDLVCDADGRAELDLAPHLELLPERGYLQALFTPAGVEDSQHLGRWSNVAMVEPLR